MGKWIIDFLFTSSLLILAILALRFLLRGKVSMRLQYAMWLVVSVKLLIFPVPWIESSLSVLNLTETIATDETQTSNTRTDFSFPEGAYVSAPEAEDFYMESSNALQSESADKDTYQNDASISDPTSIPVPEESIISVFKQYWELIFCVTAGAGTLLIFVLFAVYDDRLNRLLKKNRLPLPLEQDSIPVYLMEGLPSPCLYRNAIYIPPEVMIDEQKFMHVLAHENCHYKHRDGFWSLVCLLCLACYWWHPLVWVAAHVSRQDCELACDEAAIRLLGEEERIAYGRTLIGLISQKTDLKTHFSLSTTMTGGKKNMKQRIRQIAKRPKVMIPACVLLVILAGLVLFCTITGTKQSADDAKQDTTVADTAASETSTGTETTNPEETQSQEPTAIEPEELFQLLKSEGGTEYLNINQIICDKNVDALSSREELVSQYQLDELLTADTVPNTLIYRLSETYNSDLSIQYNHMCDQQELSWERLELSPDCHYYIAKTVGSLEATEVDYEEFITYFLEYETPGKECQAFFQDGSICKITLLNPYEGIAFQHVQWDHFFYEHFGTDVYYKRKVSYEADVEHTVDHTGSSTEIIEVYTGDVGDGDSGMVLIKDTSGQVIWDIEAHTTRAGWNNIYLTEVNGKEYLLELRIEDRDGYGAYSYVVYSLEQILGTWDGTILLNGASFSYSSTEDLTGESYHLWADAMNPYLENATLLLSTQDGVIRTEPINEYEKYNKEALIQHILQN